MKKIVAVLLAMLLVASIIPVSALETVEETNEVQEIVEISEDQEVISKEIAQDENDVVEVVTEAQKEELTKAPTNNSRKADADLAETGDYQLYFYTIALDKNKMNTGETQKLSGRITDNYNYEYQEGAKIEVTLDSNTDLFASTYTDNGGYFEITIDGSKLTTGSHSIKVKVTKDGFRENDKTLSFTVEEATKKDMSFKDVKLRDNEIMRHEGNGLEGYVVDEKGEGIDGVAVVISYQKEGDSPVYMETRNTSKGKFELALESVLFEAGSYSIIVSASKDGYKEAEQRLPLTVIDNRNDVVLTLSKQTSVDTIYKPNDTVDYTISYKDANTKREIKGVKFKIYKSDGTLIKTTKDKTFTISAADYPVGTENFYVETDGDDVFKGAKTDQSLLTGINIAKQQTSFDGKTEGDGVLTVDPSTVLLGKHKGVTISGTLKAKKSGDFTPLGEKDVEVYIEGIGNIKTPKTSSDGQFSLVYDSFDIKSAGEYKVYATFAGDDTYAASSNQAIGKLIVKDLSVSGEFDDVDGLIYKNPDIANAQVSLNLKGFENRDSEITYSIANTQVSGTTTLSDEDTFTVDLTSLDANDYTLNVTVNDNVGTSKEPYTCDIKFTIKKAKVNLTADVEYLTPDNTEATAARYNMDSAQITFTLTDEFDNPIENQKLGYNIIGTGFVEKYTDSNGEGIVDIPAGPYTPGTYSGTVKYTADKNHEACDNVGFELEVIKQKTTTSLTIDPVKAKINNDDVTFYASVIGEDGKALEIIPMDNLLAPTSGKDASIYGTITLTTNGTEIAKGDADTSELSKEYAKINWAAGKYTTVAAFSGNDYYEASEDTQNSEVIKKESKIELTVKEDGDDVVADVKVTDEDGKPLEGVKVDIMVNGKSIGIITTGANGEASLKISKSDLPEGAVIEAKIDGEGDIAPSSAKYTYKGRPTSKKTDGKQNGTPIQTGSQNALALIFFLALAAALVVVIQKKRSMDK